MANSRHLFSFLFFSAISLLLGACAASEVVPWHRNAIFEHNHCQWRLGRSESVECRLQGADDCFHASTASKVLPLHSSTISEFMYLKPKVQVADLEWIEVMSAEDDISVMYSGWQDLEILARTNGGHVIESSQYVHMNILVHVEENIIDLFDGENLLSPGRRYLNSSKLRISGRANGVTTLYVTARKQSGLAVQSAPKRVVVYPKPTLHPNDIVLVPGASCVLTLKGGPSSAVRVVYTSKNDETAKIDNHSGQLFAILPGKTTVTATFYGFKGTEICRVEVEVRVVVPASMTLKVQSEQLAAGHDMPIFPLLSEGNLFSFYDRCKNYKWFIEDEKVLTFQETRHNYKETGFLDMDFIRLVHGRSAGRTKVLHMFCCDFTSHSHDRCYASSVTVSVVSKPPLSLGSIWILPPHYTTSSLLPSSKSKKCSALNCITNARYIPPYRPLLTPAEPKQILHDIWADRPGTIFYSVLVPPAAEGSPFPDTWCGSSIAIDGDRIRTTYSEGITTRDDGKEVIRTSNNFACIRAEDDTTGIQTIACCVKVAKIYQMRIGEAAASRVFFRLLVGDELELPIVYSDHLGNPFLEANGIYRHEADTSRGDIVAVDSSKLHKCKLIIKALRPGVALVRVRSQLGPHATDYILVSVEV